MTSVTEVDSEKEEWHLVHNEVRDFDVEKRRCKVEWGEENDLAFYKKEISAIVGGVIKIKRFGSYKCQRNCIESRGKQENILPQL
jgi:hypothetical protein